MARSPKLPPTAPVPEPVARATEGPVPDEKPANASAGQDGRMEGEQKQVLPGSEKPSEIPVPDTRPADAGETGEPENPAEREKTPEKKPAPDPRSALIPDETMPAQEVACRARLKALGVGFEEHKAESEPASGCAIPYPLMLTKLGKSVDIAPQAEMNCQMAEAVARFVADTVSPAAKARLGAEVKAVDHASAYVCRPRHNGGKMSEHAFGNALDIASFTLTDGAKIEIEPAPPEKEKKFLADIRKAACGPFKTVLGPGSDPDHELHFHLDLEPRRNGGTFCQ